MRASLTTIQQTLTPEAAAVLNQSIAEATRRCHGQTTPLHVAATLLASPSGFLRQACIRSHPNSSHPLQCRALELCFSVALERLPTAAGDPPPADPPISNALMAALKRAQAHQRRGCPEQQQQPLLAVKVELEQLIISILDDPSVSRVMREASFSSPAVKAAIEQSLITSSSSSPPPHHSNSIPSSSPAGPKIGMGFRPMGPTPSPTPMSGRSPYLNPRLQNQQGMRPNSGNLGGQSRDEDVRKVIETLSRTKKKNPVLMGESEPQFVLKEVLRRIDKRELGEAGPLSNVEIISMEKELGLARLPGSARLKELGGLIERRRMCMTSGNGGLILDLGDLKWLVDQPPSLGVQHQGVSEAANEAVAEMGKILGSFHGGGEGNNGGGRIWVIGTATWETYLRCRVYYPTMENEWDLQAVSIVAKAPLQSAFPRIGTNGILRSSSESFSPLKNLPKTLQPSTCSERSPSQDWDPSRKVSCCSKCLQSYKQEVPKLSAGQCEKPVSDSKSEATQKQLPQWLQNATVHNRALDSAQTKDQDPFLKRQSEELMKKWSDRCLLLHPSFHQNGSLERSNPTPLSLQTSLYANPNLLTRQPVHPKTLQTKTLGDDLSLNINSLTAQPVEHLQTPPGSPVRTDLVLGPTKTQESTTIEKTQKDLVKDLLGCISSGPLSKVSELQSDKPLDADSFKKLLKGLIEKVWWQRDAASAVATTVTRCKLGNGRRRAGGAKGDIWMLFSGPDRTGKKKMAAALSDVVCCTGPVIICLGLRRDGEESDMNFRGKTVLDRITEAVRRNPFSVIVLQDIDEADVLVRGSIKRAMERGRFTDSHGREISLGKIIFILTVNNRPPSSDGHQLDEEKLASIVSDSWQLKLSVSNQKGGKRHPCWLINEEERVLKQRREMGASVSFDLNEIADTEEDRLDGSHNSSDLTVEHEEKGHDNRHSPTTTSAPRELLDLVDETIVFKPVTFGLLRQNVESTIMARFRAVLGEKLSVKIDVEALDRIFGGAWLGSSGLDSWVEKVLAPTIHQLKSRMPSLAIASPEEIMVARLEIDDKVKADSVKADSVVGLLPSRIMVSVDNEANC